LKEINSQNRKFTWTNEREGLTMCKLDGFFCNSEWDICFPNHVLHALSSSLSDHFPLLASNRGPMKPRNFKFENFWIKMPGFHKVVADAWAEPVEHSEPCHILFNKLKKVGFRLKRWGHSFFSEAKIQFHMALNIILKLDIAMESRA
jgi:hypothetical protein